MRWRPADGEHPLPLDRLIFFAFVIFVPVALGAAPKIFADGDVSWHLASGQWIIDHGRIPDVDPFSFTKGGGHWVAFEWLAQLIYAGAFAIGGYRAMAASVMLALMALHFTTFIFLARRAEPVAMALAFVAMDIVLASFLFARPHVLAWPILAIWTAVLLDCRDKKRNPPIWLALMMLVWANLHGSFVLGFGIAGAIALDALIGERWDRRVFFGWLNFGLAALILALLNANGMTGFLHPIMVMGHENLAYIDEWQPSTPALTPFFYAVLVVALGAIIVKRVKLTVGEAILLLVLTIMAFAQVRHQSWLVIVAPLLLVPKFSTRAHGHAPQTPLADAGRTTWMQGGLAFGLLAILSVSLLLPAQPVESGGNPHGLMANIPSTMRDEPVLNGYSFGGPLILAGIRPYIDGRSDMYGDPFVADYFQIVSGNRARFDAAVAKYGIAWTMLPPKTGLVAVLDASPDWTRIYADDIGVIHVRRPAPRS